MATLGTRVGLVFCLAAWAPCAGGLRAQAVRERAQVAETLPHYQPGHRLRGSVPIPCTDTMARLGRGWNRAFRKYQPEARLAFLPSPTQTAVQALLRGSRPLIVITRELTPEEMQVFQARFGRAPLRIPVCLDANIVFVNKSNPIPSITMEQLDAIYSRDRLGGAGAPARVWADLGVEGELAGQAITAYSRSAGTSARASFASQALLGGPFRAGVLDRESPAALAKAVSQDQAGIAFGPMAAWSSANKVLPVVPYHGTDAYFPSQARVTSSLYPMPRIFYAYLNRDPARPLDPRIGETLHFLLAQEGQSAVAELGLLPGPVEFIAASLKRLEP